MKDFLEAVVDTFRNRPGKSLMLLVSIVLGLVTKLNYQKLSVPTVSEVFKSILENDTELLLTWGFNVISIAFIISTGFIWLKESFNSSCFYDYSEIVSRVTCFITGLMCFLFSYIFLYYILTELIGLVIVSGIVFLWLSSNNDSSRRRRRRA